MAEPLELAGAYARTEEGNIAQMYGGGGVAYANTSAACAFVPLALRKGTTVGVWENGKVVEYIWHTDTSNTGLVKKIAEFSGTAPSLTLDNNNQEGGPVIFKSKFFNDWKLYNNSGMLRFLLSGSASYSLALDADRLLAINVEAYKYRKYNTRGAAGYVDSYAVDNSPAFYNQANNEVVLSMAELTGNRTYTLPDADGKLALAGDVAPKANTTETINGTDNAKFVTAFTLAAWWTDVKTRIQIFANEINFTGGLKKNGVDVATSTDVSAKLSGTAATDAETQIGAAVPEDGKFVSRIKLFNWFAWVKTQQHTISRWIFNVLNLSPGAAPAAPQNGDMWYDNTSNTFKKRANGLTKTAATVEGNPALVGAQTRIVEASADGSLAASVTFDNMFVFDADITSAIESATYTNSRAYITPANSKVMVEGQMYAGTNTFYIAVQNNYVFKVK